MSDNKIAQILLWKQNDGYEFLAEIDPDDFPFKAIEIIAKVLADNKHKHGVGAWKKIPVKEHAAHAALHLVEYHNEHLDEPHLHHALCRLAMAVALAEKDE